MRNIRCNCSLRAKLNFINKVLKNKNKFSSKVLKKNLDADFQKEIDKIKERSIIECPNTNEICEVFETPNMGRGIRAKNYIPPNFCIGCYIEDLRKNKDVDEDNWRYSFYYVLNGYYIDGSKLDSITSLINHSNNPNLSIRNEIHIADGIEELHITFYTKREIQPKEELYIDYGPEYWVYAEKNGIRRDTKQRLITEYFNSY